MPPLTALGSQCYIDEPVLPLRTAGPGNPCKFSPSGGIRVLKKLLKKFPKSLIPSLVQLRGSKRR